MKSVHAIILISLLWTLAGTFYYPKWNKNGPEAAISYDVSGYYHYLPAIFIYNDIRKQNWTADINQKYLPSPIYDQSFDHAASGNKVNKYAIGQAVLFSPFFMIAHTYATITKTFPADGYSKPYQFAIWTGGLLISILGLVLLNKILVCYFTEETTAWTLIALGVATHWLEYAAISNGMNHTWLFTILCALILFSRKFHTKADWGSAIGIGVSLGLAILTRPTAIVWSLIPLLWNIRSIHERSKFITAHWQKIVTAILICGLIYSIQLIYWKYVTDSWIVYSYGEQKLKLTRLLISKNLFSPNIGWWTYTPLMLITMLGWYEVYRKFKPLFWPLFLTSFIAIYLTFSWRYWDTGGGLGHRDLIQIYPLLSFPLACVIEWLIKRPVGRWIWIVILALNIYYSLWWVYDAHHGGFKTGGMTKKYFYSIAGRLHPDRDLKKLLDTDEYFKGTPHNPVVIYQNDFESDPSPCQHIFPDSTKAACMNKDVQVLGPFTIPLNETCNKWIRFEGDFTVVTREWNTWNFAQWAVHFYDGSTPVKFNSIRLQRLITEDNAVTHLFFDVRLPEKKFDKCEVVFWNVDSPHTILVDNLKAACFSD